MLSSILCIPTALFLDRSLSCSRQYLVDSYRINIFPFELNSAKNDSYVKKKKTK